MSELGLTGSYDPAAAINAAERIDGKVTFSSEWDVDEVLAYYGSNKHQHVDDRDPDQLTQEVTDGRLLLIRAEGELVAASSAFNYSVEKGQASPSWIEIGATRATLGGFGFYPFIIASQVMEECFERPPEGYIFANIYEDNAAVRGLLGKKTGWDEFIVADDPDLEGTYSRKNDACKQEMSSWIWLRSTPNCMPHQAEIVRSVIQEGGFWNRKDPEHPKFLAVDFSDFSLATPDAIRKLDILAEGDFSDFLSKKGRLLSCKDVSEALQADDTSALIAQHEM